MLFTAAPMVMGGPLYQAYTSHGPVAGAGAVRSCFDHDPWQHESEAARRSAAVDLEWTGDRAALAEMLVALNRHLGAPAPALGAAARLAEPGALAVVAGQQAGLFGGPLYTVHKALGAVALARRMEALLRRPVVPVFWAATEDHDLAEADHAWFPDGAGIWQRVRYVPQGVPEGLSVGAIPLQAGPLEQALSRLAGALPGGYAGPKMVQLARDAAASLGASTYGAWFCRLMAVLLGPLGLPVVDPMAPAARALAAPGVRRILEHGTAVQLALGAGVARIEAAGLSPQVQPAAGEVNLFFYPEGPAGPRQALVRTGDGRLCTREGRSEAGLDHYIRLSGQHPELFGGNVATRPLLQDEIFPTLAYVAGPGEIAYYSQFRELYSALGRTMPLIWPRPSVTLVEPAARRRLARHGLSLEGLPDGLDARRRELLRAADETGVEALIQTMQERIAASYGPVLPALAGFDEVLGRLAADNRRRVMDQTAWLAKKARQVLTQRCRTGLDQLERVRSSLWPRGGPQERTANILYYLARYGPELLVELAELPAGPPFVHHYAMIG